MEEQKTISKSEKRWLVRELEAGRMSLSEACAHIAAYSKDPRSLIYYWQKQFSSDLILTLPAMTEKEKQILTSKQMQASAEE